MPRGKRPVDLSDFQQVGSRRLIDGPFKVDGKLLPYVRWICDDCNSSDIMTVSHWKQSVTCCGKGYVSGRDRIRIVWDDMHGRCNDEKHPAYSRYQHLSISGWKNYREFREWCLSNGYEVGLDIDRIDNSQGYNPENCRFVNRKINNNNRSNNVRLTAFGETKTVEEWALDPRCSVQGQSIIARIQRYGFSVEDAITRPSKFSRTAIQQAPLS